MSRQKKHLCLVEGGGDDLPEYVQPTLEQRTRAVKFLSSDCVKELVELSYDLTHEAMHYHIGQMAVNTVDEQTTSTLESLLEFEDVDWEYVGEALVQGPGTPVHHNAGWIVANAIARHEHFLPDQTA